MQGIKATLAPTAGDINEITEQLEQTISQSIGEASEATRLSDLVEELRYAKYVKRDLPV